MILKNEAHNIAATIYSVRGAVDKVVVLDTGSTDGTQDVVTKSCADAGIPLELHEGPFVDFATTRNRCNELHAKGPNPAVFTLMMSGDETLYGGKALREFLQAHVEETHGSYQVTMNLNFSYWTNARVLRTDANWQYVGTVHELPKPPEGQTQGPVIPGVTITHSASDEERRQARIRDYDLPALTKTVEDESIPLVERANAIWFLARTHEHVAENNCDRNEVGGAYITHKMAAMALYRRRAELEAHYAKESGVNLAESEDKASICLFSYYRIAETLNLYSPDELVWRLQKIVSEFKEKHPGLYWMLAAQAAQLDAETGLQAALTAADVAREAKKTPTGTPNDSRFEWLSLLLAIECAKHLGRKELLKPLAERAIDADGPVDDFMPYLMGQA
jgi:glycosyltransferase involved in cell wall biosynthesis